METLKKINRFITTRLGYGGSAFAAGLITYPSADNLIASSTEWSVPFASALFPILGIVVGVGIGAMVVSKVISVLIRGAKRVVGGRGRRGGRRRR